MYMYMYIHVSPGAPRGVPGKGMSVLSSLSPGARRGVPGEGLFVCRHYYMLSFTLSSLYSDFSLYPRLLIIIHFAVG